MVASHAHNPGMCPDPESNQQPLSFQGSAPSTEPHQPGVNILLLLKLFLLGQASIDDSCSNPSFYHDGYKVVTFQLYLFLLIKGNLPFLPHLFIYLPKY